ncbi:Transcriptional repressor protein YY1 [Trichinella britovi]|uniref:Transcriptional repressor protein YY1 n=1 Tax=Trichinella britovi TaxID=45882 RepID=A0A0V1D0G8_TRIBR|nr:Transcriptional repressor protein YY1 [Trichinella britovi]
MSRFLLNKLNEINLAEWDHRKVILISNNKKYSIEAWVCDGNLHSEIFASESEHLNDTNWVNPSINDGRTGESRTEKEDPTKPFKCPHRGCNKAFAKQKYVRQHLQRHGPRTHMCTRCNKAFDDSSKLKRHNLIHSKEKPHVCPVDGCGKSFSVYYNMKVHLGTHSKYKPHACVFPGCNKRFLQLVNLRAHVKIHNKAKQAIGSIFGAQRQQKQNQLDHKLIIRMKHLSKDGQRETMCSFFV